MGLDILTGKIIGYAIEVHRILGRSCWSLVMKDAWRMNWNKAA